MSCTKKPAHNVYTITDK